MAQARRVTIRSASAEPEITDLVPAEEEAFVAGLAQATAAEGQEQTRRANRGTLRGKAQQALTDNAGYLAIPSPSAGQVAQQVARLTRSQSALIRLLTGVLDSTDGT